MSEDINVQQKTLNGFFTNRQIYVTLIYLFTSIADG